MCLGDHFGPKHTLGNNNHYFVFNELTNRSRIIILFSIEHRFAISNERQM